MESRELQSTAPLRFGPVADGSLVASVFEALAASFIEEPGWMFRW